MSRDFVSARAQREKAPPLPDGRMNMNPPDVTFWQLIAEDFRTHNSDILAQGFWCLFWHRFGNWRMSVRVKPLRMILTVVYRTMFRLGQRTAGIKLPYTVRVGRRVRLEHFGGMVLVPRSIGNDVIVRQNTTMGIATETDLNARPVLEDFVDVGAGAVLLGNCVIGRGSVIGANAVVTKSVEPYSVMVGVPAVCIRKRDPAEIAPAGDDSSAQPQFLLP